MAEVRAFVRGDAHGYFEWIQDFCENNHTTRNDVLILLGDSGILYGEKEDAREHMLKQYLSTLPITILDIQGNHSCPPEDRAAEGYLKTLMKLGDDMVGIAYQNFQYPNIYHAVNGNTYYIADHPCLVVGGAASIDKEYRQMMGWYWTENEVISLQEMNNILHQIHTRHFDFCFTHTIPTPYTPTDLFIKGVDESKADRRMEDFLVRVKKEITYDKWYCGHWHANRKNAGPNIDILFDEVEQII